MGWGANMGTGWAGGSVGEGLHLLLLFFLLLLADPGFQALPNPSWAGKEFKASALFSLPVCADKPGAKQKKRKRKTSKSRGSSRTSRLARALEKGEGRKEKGGRQGARESLPASRLQLPKPSPSFSSRSDARRPGPFPAQAMDPRRRGKGWVGAASLAGTAAEGPSRGWRVC